MDECAICNLPTNHQLVGICKHCYEANMELVKIVIIVEGGVVQSVYTNAGQLLPNAVDVNLLDFDNLKERDALNSDQCDYLFSNATKELEEIIF